jgi:hypothetical protein
VPDQAPDFGREAIDIRLGADHPVQQRCTGRLSERPFARSGEGQDSPQAEDVAGRPDVMAFGLFRGHEPGRADHHASTGQRSSLHGPANPEIDQSWPIFRQEYIRWLQVTMHHTRGVDCAQALSEPRGQPQHRCGRQWSTVGHRIGEGWPGYIGRS